MLAKEEANKAFEANAVADASADQLSKWLQAYCCGSVTNELVKHREVIRGITINHIQMGRVIREVEGAMREIDKSNKKTQKLVVTLTIAALVVGVLQIVLAAMQLCQKG